MKYKLFIYSVFFILMMIGCKSIKNQVDNKIVIQQTPDTFESTYSNTDSTVSIAEKPHNLFFNNIELSALIDTALKNNLDLAIYKQRIFKYKADFDISKGLLLPSLSFDNRVGIDKYGRYTMNGVGNFETNANPALDSKNFIPNPTPDFNFVFRSNWEIDVWGKLKNAKKASYLRFMASQKGNHALITEIVNTVALIYYNQLRCQKEIRIIRKNIALQDSIVSIIKYQKDAGRATELAVKQSEALLLNTKALELEIQNEMYLNQNKMRLILNKYERTDIFNLKTEINENPLEKIGVPAKMIFNRPDIQEAELNLKANKLDLVSARRAFFPSLNLDLYSGVNSFKIPLLFSTPESLVWGVLGGLVAPIFTKNKLKSNLKIANANQTEALLQYHKKIFSAYIEVNSLLNSLNRVSKMIELKEEEVATLKTAVTISSELFVVGYANYIEIITAQTSVLRAEIQLVTMDQELQNIEANLYKALGGGWR